MSHPHRRRLAAKPRRRGILTPEFLLILPILMIFLLAVIELGLWLHVGQRLATASREGARVAALGGSGVDVERAVRHALGHGKLATARISAALVGEGGEPIDPGQPIAVCVEIPASEVVPDLLRFVGISHRGHRIERMVVMRRE